MCESTGKSAEIADSGRKRIIACKQSTIQHEQTYKLLKSNLLSLTVGFNRIDGNHDKDNRLNLLKQIDLFTFNMIIKTYYER